MKLLIVEDSNSLAGLLVAHLGQRGYALDRAADAAGATRAMAAATYAAVLLDLGLPDEDGVSWLRRLRAQGDATPVIVVTARAGVADRVTGLAAGADDYVAKPFEIDELVARVEAVLRRSGKLLGDALALGNVVLDARARQVFVDGAEMACPAREMATLELLLRQSGNVVPKRFIEDHLYGLSNDANPNTTEVYVYRLRRLLAVAGATVAIHTIRGVGYLLAEAAEPSAVN